MDSPLVDGSAGGALTDPLARFVADSKEIASLHELLGGYCHDCRNALHAMKMSLYLARRNAPPETSAVFHELEPSYHAVERVFDRLHSICKPMPLTRVEMPLSLLIEQNRPRWEEWARTRGHRLELIGPAQRVAGEYDPFRLGTGLDALVEWRSRAGEPGRTFTLRWRAEGAAFRVEWEESGPGLPDVARTPGEVASDLLALPFLTRIVAAHGGEVDLDTRDGWRLRMHWPLSDRCTS